MANSKDLLLIFTRNPELGKCKTRLAATIGDDSALEIYKFLLQHTVNITKDLKVAKQVYYSEAIWKHDIWPNEIYKKGLQEGIDLGDRMSLAFRRGFDEGFERIIIIGSDMHDLSLKDLENAFDMLMEHDFVVGPANDGGYYLLGMRALNEELFKNKTWGGDTVLSSTLNDLKGEKVAQLEVRNDVDVYEDIENDSAFLPFIKHLKNDKKTT